MYFYETRQGKGRNEMKEKKKSRKIVCGRAGFGKIGLSDVVEIRVYQTPTQSQIVAQQSQRCLQS